VAASIKKPPHPNGGEMMWRCFLMKGTFWGMFFVGVGFGVTPGSHPFPTFSI